MTNPQKRSSAVPLLIGLGVLLAVGCCGAGGLYFFVSTAAAPPMAPELSSEPRPPSAALGEPAPSAALSTFVPEEAACVWKRIDASRKTDAVRGRFDVKGCIGARVAWSPDLRVAVVSFDPTHVARGIYSSAQAVPRGHPDEVVSEGPRTAFRVDVDTAAVTALSLSGAPDLKTAQFGVAANHEVIAMIEEALSEETIDSNTVTIDGMPTAIPDGEGLPALAHAFAWRSGAWTKVETHLTTTGWDYAQGVAALEVSGTLGPSSDDMLSARGSGEELTEQEATAMKAATPADEGAWVKLTGMAKPVFVWTVTAEFSYRTGLVRVGAPPAELPSVQFTSGDLVAIEQDGWFLLISGASTGAHSRLYDLRTPTLLFSSDTARATTLWPKPKPGPTH